MNVKAIEIKPTDIFRYGDSIIQIICTPTQGWKRGRIKIDNFTSKGLTAYAKNIVNGSVYDVRCTSNKDDIILHDLYPAKNYLEKLLQRKNSIINEMNIIDSKLRAVSFININKGVDNV